MSQLLDAERRTAAATGTPPTVAEAIVDFAAAHGCRYLFGVSGANIEHLHDAVHRFGGPLENVLAKREDAAGFMADAYARMSGSLGLCCATSGGGMMNLVAALAESLADGVPVLAVVGHPPAEFDGSGGFQEATGRPGTVDALGLLASVTKFAARVDDPRELPRTLSDAATAALTGRRGPSVLLIPRDVFDEPVLAAADDGLARCGADAPSTVGRPVDSDRTAVPSRAALADLAARLAAAQRPAVVLGPELSCEQGATLAGAIARVGGVYAATMSARDRAPVDGPGYLGTVGAAGHPSTHRYLLHDADFVLFAGTDLPMLVRGPIAGIDGAAVAVLARSADVARRVLPHALTAEGRVDQAVDVLVDALAGVPGRRPPTVPRQVVRPIPAYPTGLAQGLAPSQVADALTPFLASFGAVVTDAGNCGAAVLHRSDLPAGTRGLVAFGMGGMGYAVPASIAAALHTGRPVLACVGDGSFLMNGTEIHTAAELGTGVLAVVFNNAMHAMCVSRQHQFFDGRLAASTYGASDFAAVARGLVPSRDDMFARSVHTVEQLREAIGDFLAHPDRPGVLDVRLAEEEVPPMTPFSVLDGSSAIALEPAPAGRR